MNALLFLALFLACFITSAMKSEPNPLIAPQFLSSKSPAVAARYFRLWLMTCMAMVILMVFIGGVTRLTESGLSIVEWKLLSGTLPPLTEPAWQNEFLAYQSSPEFIHKNAYFTLQDFKRIFWLEYIHRLLGRLTGMVFLLPLAYACLRRNLPAPALKRMSGITLLVGMQGLMGWVMVQSGLVDLPRVHPINLAMHLGLAAIIFICLMRTYWRFCSASYAQDNTPLPSNTQWLGRAAFTIFFIQFLLGAIVAGADAGYSYNSYPLMDGRFIPNGLFTLSPWWSNFIENITTVQFMHRMGALLLVISAGSFAYQLLQAGKNAPSFTRAGRYIFFALALQFCLGIATLLSVVHIAFASAHQLVAFFLLYHLMRPLINLKQ